MEGNLVKFWEGVGDKRPTIIAELTQRNFVECVESRWQGPKFRNEYGFGVFQFLIQVDLK